MNCMPKRAPLFIAVAFIIVAVLLSEPEKIVSSFLHFRRDLIIPVILQDGIIYLLGLLQKDLLTFFGLLEILILGMKKLNLLYRIPIQSGIINIAILAYKH